MDGGRWIATKEACALYGVSGNTIRRWADNGSIDYKRTPGNNRVFYISSNGVFASPTKTKSNYIYARVSSYKQRDDMERQISFLRDKYPNYTIIKDIGSGLNYKRRGLLKLLELSSKGNIDTIVVFSKDRLCRFGFDLFSWIFDQNNTKLLVYEHQDKSPEQEFTEDILAILQVFACRWNGKRKYTISKDKEVQIEVISKAN